MIAELFILSLFAPIATAGSYIVTFPDSLIPGVDLGARVTIIGATGPVQVVATLQYSQNNTHISTTSKTVTNGVPSTINIKVPEDLQSSKYKVSITGSGGLTFRNESDIHFEDKNLFIFVQTDKTRYSAGQKVMYRAILLHPNLLGFNGSFTITIYDGKDNKIEVTDYLKTEDGVVTGSLQLSREPVFGTWKIKINAPTESFTKQFDVNDYVLPRFRVEITLPTDLKMSATFLQIGITAKFTFNTDVFGNCTIQIYNKQNRHILKEYWKQIKGQVNFSIPMTDLKEKLSIWEDIVVRALVTDNATALTIAAEEDLKFTYTHQKTLSLTIPEARDTFVPGLTYHTKIFVGYDDEPIGTSGVINVTPEVITAEIVQCLLNNPPTKWLDVKSQTLQNFTLHFDESGYAALNFLVGAHTDRIVFQFSYAGIQRHFSVDSISSRPVDQLRMNVGRSHFRVGENVTLSSESTVLMNGEISYEIYARGILLKTVASGLVHTKHSSIDFEVTGDMVPQVYVVATYVTNSGVLLTDYVSIKVSGSPCKNKVSIKYNTTSLEPREGLKMDISADPNSTVYIMLEDEKNRLLGSENDIFFSEIEEKVVTTVQNARSTRIRRQNVFEGMALSSNHHSIENRWQEKKQVSKRNYNAAENIYKKSGVVVLSNIDLVTKTDVSGLLMFDTTLPRKCLHLTTTTWAPGRVIYAGAHFNLDIVRPGFLPGLIMQTTPAPVTVEAKEIIRNRFPETWLWEEYHIGPSGNLAVTKTAPDAITSWVSSVFATNPNTGFGISNVKQKIIVKKSFFLTMGLPNSIILGEEILVQITVFNYMSIPQQVFLQVERSDDPGNPIPAATMVQSNEGHSTYVRVTPKRLGILKINVHAKAGFFSTSASDALEKEVNVLPVGVHKTTNAQRLVDVTSGGQPYTETLTFKDHPYMINGTKHVYMKITGNFMVPSIDGLQNLIRLPHGCGEQTMVNFAPDVFITKYLNTTGQLTKEIKNKAVDYIRNGYQRELGYRHSNGAFSIWGSSDRYGSTWLTAYVLKSFHQANELITIDNDVLTAAMRWLLAQQRTDGSFTERLPVYYVDHRSTGTGLKLTAFTLISIVECRNTPNVQANQIASVIAKGKHYLETKLSSVSDAYTLSMVCYALAKSGSSYASSCYSKLESCKHIDGGKVFWTESSPVVRRQNFARTPQSRAPARDIETTAYALLTYIALGHHAQGLPIVKWLVSQRNPQGGFSSTQDTVISIQALTEYALKHTSIAINYGVQFNVFAMGFSHSYGSTAKNFDSTHQVEIPSSLDNVIIQAMGNGIAVVDVIQSFYVSSVENGTYISVTTSIEKESLNSITVQAVIRWRGPTDSRMILTDFEMPTGFVVDGDFFRSQSHVRRHEVNGRKVALYLDGITQNGQSVVRVKMDRSDPVVKNQACHVTVYDYYEPTQQAVTRYESGLLKRANICDVCPLCNFCTGSSGFPQIGIGK